eukprot:5065410-Prymnesium_polylepis.1
MRAMYIVHVRAAAGWRGGAINSCDPAPPSRTRTPINVGRPQHRMQPMGAAPTDRAPRAASRAPSSRGGGYHLT